MGQWLAQQVVTKKGPSLSPRRVERTPAFFDIVNICHKLMMGKTEGLFAVLVVQSVNFALAKSLEHKWSI